MANFDTTRITLREETEHGINALQEEVFALSNLLSEALKALNASDGLADAEGRADVVNVAAQPVSSSEPARSASQELPQQNVTPRPNVEFIVFKSSPNGLVRVTADSS